MNKFKHSGDFKGQRLPPEIIEYEVRPDFRFSLSLRDVENLLAAHCIILSCETIQKWVGKFGTKYAAFSLQDRYTPSDKWHSDEVVIPFQVRRFWLWRAIDSNCDVFGRLAQCRRNNRAMQCFFCKLHKQYVLPNVVITDKLGSYQAALKSLTRSIDHRRYKGYNIISEGLHRPTRRREKVIARFKSIDQTPLFLSTDNPFKTVFRPRLHKLSAHDYRQSRSNAHSIWGHMTCELKVGLARGVGLFSSKADKVTMPWKVSPRQGQYGKQGSKVKRSGVIAATVGRLPWMLFRGVAFAVLTVPVLGCGQAPPFATSQNMSVETDTEVIEGLPVASHIEMTELPVTKINLVAGTILFDLAERIDEMAIVRSSTIHDLRAAEAEQKALRFDFYPRIRPTASAPLTGGERASIGLNIEQLMWAGGRTRARLSDAELKIAETSLRGWAERNEAVLDGLEAYLNMARYEARILELGNLRQKLGEINTLLETRLAGGVSDRGELLRINVALQELQRRLVSDTAALRQARTDFARQLPDANNTPTLPDLRAAASQCSRVWPDSEAPADALARVTTARAEASEGVVRAQRFPRVVVVGGINYAKDGFSEPTIGIRLDASDMLGLGRKANLDAAEAFSKAASAAYALQKDETMAALARFEANFNGLQSDAASLRELARQNEAALDLYEEQLDAGSIAITDGIVLHRAHSDGLITLIDVEADILLNCLSSSERRGLLAKFEVTNDAN